MIAKQYGQDPLLYLRKQRVGDAGELPAYDDSVSAF